MFKKIVGKKCKNPDCEHKDKTREDYAVMCDCGQALEDVTVVDKTKVTILAVTIVLILGAGAYFGIMKTKVFDTVTRADGNVVGTIPESAKNKSIDKGQPSLQEIKETVDKAVLSTTFKNGMGYASQRMYDNALKEFIIVEKNDPNFPDLQMNMGVACMTLKNYETARTHLRRALEQTPDNPLVEYNLGCLFALTGKKEEALQSIQAAVSHGFTDVNALKSDGDLKSLHGHPAFQSLLKTVSENSSARRKD